MGDVKSQLTAGGTVFLTAASTGEIERFADICREYEVPYVLGESEDAAAGFTAEGAQESAAMLLIRAPFAEGVTFPDARLTLFGHADLFDVTPTADRPSRKIRTSGFFGDFAELKPSDYLVHVDHAIGQFSGIADGKGGMERGEPMDRLLCGDVGYGKTEVAMRAAFKTVMDNKQVAVLAPTTVLTFQHFETFKKRFAAFPARIEMLSRFRSAAEQKKILADLEAGKVDVVIGTHRLLSKDVKFPDLGLLVVDEEQRFGVAHKERLKEMRKNVDALALSATPIPRTLHMSLVGLRDMSVIETPPRDRLAIQTVVAPFQEDLVRRAIETELAREGQGFFIHNRVESIHSLGDMVTKLAPKARVVVAPGQMGEKELESVMLKFIRDQADVLVATNIVEKGLDIPRANTILINRADRLGLAELYQLRGRVGRSSQRAYAYLLVPPDTSLSEIARKRLAAMKEFSELGAGFRIAALDLELRGACNMLGRQQHGHIEPIGFDIYSQMLEPAVS